MIPVGGLAIAALLAERWLGDVVGQRFVVDGRAVIPLPHPVRRERVGEPSPTASSSRAPVELVGTELRLP